MDVKKVRVAIAKALETIPGIQVSAYVLSNPTVPALQVVPGPSERLSFRRGATERDFKVQAIVGLTSDVGSQLVLDQFLDLEGSRSVVAALTADPTFGGVCDDSDVTGDTGVEIFTRDGGPPALGSEWTVKVVAAS